MRWSPSAQSVISATSGLSAFCAFRTIFQSIEPSLAFSRLIQTPRGPRSSRHDYALRILQPELHRLFHLMRRRRIVRASQPKFHLTLHNRSPESVQFVRDSFALRLAFRYIASRLFATNRG